MVSNKQTYFITIITVIILFVTVFDSYSIEKQSPQPDYYKMGQESIKNGDINEGLDYWLKGRNTLLKQGKFNPQISISFIETVTKYEMEKLYGHANKLYFEMLNEDSYDSNHEEINDEAKRLLPLIEEYNTPKSIEEWENYIKSNNVNIVYKIKQFWIKNDPTPTTEYNERLIEHWERIAYSRKKFTKSKTSVYQTDARGPFYIKYGKPDIIRDLGNHKEFPFFLDLDVWVYNNLYVGQTESVFYLFSSKGSGFYKQHASLEDMQPDRAKRAFSKKKYYALGLYIPQYYRIAMGNNGGGRTTIQLEDNSDPAKWEAPIQMSKYESIIKDILMEYSAIRYLDKNNNSKAAIFVTSLPTFIEGDYNLGHTLFTYNHKFEEVGRINKKDAKQTSNVSMFTIFNVDSSLNYSLSSSADELNTDTTPKKTFIGKEEVGKLKPLNGDLSILESSDLILGGDFPDNFEHSEYPFPVMPMKNIPIDSNIEIYFEIYHLYFGSDQQAKYKLNFIAEKLNSAGFFKKIIGKGKLKQFLSSESTLTINKRNSNERFKFDVSEFDIGEYKFTVEVTDLISGQIVRKSNIINIYESQTKSK